VLAIFRFGTVPIKRLQYDTHDCRSVFALRIVATLHPEH
jgi:hypothetical protein